VKNLLYDVIIIGGGPAGSEAGYHLAKKGYNVIILERGKENRDKSCGGGVPPIDWKEFGNYPKDIVERSVGDFNFFVNEKEVLQTSGPKGTIIKRTKFDKYLQDKALRFGAEIQYNCKVNNIKESSEIVKISSKNGIELKSRYCIGADGPFSITRKQIFQKNLDKKRCGSALHYLIQIPEKRIDELIGNHLYFFFGKLVGKGYGYIFPQREALLFGICNLDCQDFILLNKKLDSLIKTNIGKKMVGNNRYIEKKGGFIPYFPSSKLSSKRTILIGDAAGVANPIHCGGIWQARKSAKIGAEVISKALSNKIKSINIFDSFIKKEILLRDNKYDLYLQKILERDRLLGATLKMANNDQELYNAVSYLINMEKPHKDVYNTMLKKSPKIIFNYLKKFD